MSEEFVYRPESAYLWIGANKAPAEGGFGRGGDYVRHTKAEVIERVNAGGRIAVLTGKRSGYVVFDFDGPVGRESRERLAAEGKKFTRTAKAFTRDGRDKDRYHLIYKYPGFEVAQDIGFEPGIDLKADWNYHLVHPSPGYLPMVGEIEEMPEWLIERLRARAVERAEKRERVTAAEFEEVAKNPNPEACCGEFAKGAVLGILKKMDELRALPEGGRLKLYGNPVGWDSGFWLLAARLVEIARWPETRYSLKRAHADFLKHAPDDADFDAGHAWEQGLSTATTWAFGERHTRDEHAPPVTVLELSDFGLTKVGKQGANPNRPYPVLLNSESAEFAEEFANRHFRLDGVLGLRWQPEEQDWWSWDTEKGHYVMLHPDVVVKRVKKRLKGARQTADDGSTPQVKVNNRSTGELLKALQIEVTPDGGRDALQAGTGGIPFRNGWLNPITGVMEPLTPARDVRWVIPADYDPEARCDGWLAFLASLGLPDDEVRLLRQWFGYLLSGSTRLHKALMLVGPKRAGKGTIIDVAAALLGEGVGAVGIDSFDPKNSFGLETLVGKSLGVIGDARWGMKQNPGRNENLLKWITADLVSMNAKYKPHSTHRPTARLMVASNELPKVVDADGALVSRFIVVELQKSFYRNEDFDLKDRLMAELPGIANWAMEGLADLNEAGRFSETVRGREIEEELDAASKPEAMFVEEWCEFDVEAYVEKEDLYRRYRDWCGESGYFPIDKNSFFSRIYREFPGRITNGKIGGKGSQRPVVKGLKLTRSAFE